MSLRRWFRERMLSDEDEGNDVPPGGSLVNSLLGRDEERVPSLGEYRADTYPVELAEQLRRRGEVMAELLEIDVASVHSRIEAIPRLRELLRRYPHPLVYEMLIQSYMDADRYDEAKGVAFAARERRQECERSAHPEIRAELDGIREWKPEEIEELRLEHAARAG
jgi:hypothetical protein